jgi:hypothetical protein
LVLEIYLVSVTLLLNAEEVAPQPTVLVELLDEGVHELLTAILEGELLLVLEVDLDVLAQVSPTVELNL